MCSLGDSGHVSSLPFQVSGWLGLSVLLCGVATFVQGARKCACICVIRMDRTKLFASLSAHPVTAFLEAFHALRNLRVVGTGRKVAAQLMMLGVRLREVYR